MTNINNFVLDEECNFFSLKKLGPTIENDFSYLLGVIWHYLM